MRSSPNSRSTATETKPPPLGTGVNTVSPATTNGASPLSSPDRTPSGAGWNDVTEVVWLHRGVACDAACTNSAEVRFCSSGESVVTVALNPDPPDVLVTACGLPAAPTAQSRSSSVLPVRHRPCPRKKRLPRPLPLGRAAMQNGLHTAPARHARSLTTRGVSAQRGSSHTVASTSRQFPRLTQSVLGAAVTVSPYASDACFCE